MDNSYIQKGFTLATGLLRSPKHIWPYLKYCPAWGRQPIDVALPWISFGALCFLDTFVRSEHEIFEFGGGGSTLYFARHARRVVTMESHPAWHQKLTDTLTQKQLKNVACELRPISSDDAMHFTGDQFFQRVREQLWDIILIDCYCGYSKSRYGQTRPYAFDLAQHQLKPGGVIVLDDSWMFPELIASKPGWRITDYIGPGPCRYGVTSTAIFEKL